MIKGIDESALRSSEMSEEIWLVRIGSNRSFLIFKECGKGPSIYGMTGFIHFSLLSLCSSFDRFKNNNSV